MDVNHYCRSFVKPNANTYLNPLHTRSFLPQLPTVRLPQLSTVVAPRVLASWWTFSGCTLLKAPQDKMGLDWIFCTSSRVLSLSVSTSFSE